MTVSPALVGATGVLFAVGITAPQVWVSVGRGRIGGLSLAAVANTTLSAGLWLVYALMAGDIWLASSSALIALGFAAVVVAWLVAHRFRPGHDAWAVALWAGAVGSAAWLEWGRGVVGVVGILLVGGQWFSALPQLWRAWRSDDPSGVSRVGWAVATADALVWLGYGLLMGLGALVGWAVSAVTLSLAVLAVASWRRHTAAAHAGGGHVGIELAPAAALSLPAEVLVGGG